MLKLQVPSGGLTLNTKSKFCNLELGFSQSAINILVGPNGGGKTTLLRAILSPKEAGVSLLCNQKQIENLTTLKRAKLISYVGTTSGNRPGISVEDFLLFSFFKNPGVDCVDKIKEMLKDLDVSYLRNSRIDQLSEGEYKRIHIAGGLLQEAQWYLLDEPEEHLDPGALKSLAKVLLRMKIEGKSFILACHDLSFACFLADYFLGINACGELVFNEKKRVVIESKLLESLYGCDFLYVDEKSAQGESSPYLLGPKYE